MTLQPKNSKSSADGAEIINAEQETPESPEQSEDQKNSQEQVIQQLLEQAQEFKDQALRATAELQNFRRRAQQEREELRRYATENLVASLLSVLDNFERSIASAEQGANFDSLLEGVKAVDRQLRSILESVRLSKIDAIGTPFNPDHHEALESEITDEHPEDTVLQVLAPGYKMGEKVIRPAKVKVAKKP